MFEMENRTRGGLKISTIVLLNITFFVNVVSADTVMPPISYSKMTSDGNFIFVMLISEQEASYRRYVDELRTIYPESGLYPNDNSLIPLWTVKWHARSVEPLSDGIHLIRRGPWATSSDSEAIAFFSNGVLLKSYSVSDLVSFPWLMPRTASHFRWRLSEHLIEDKKQYEILTKHYEHYLFDVTTGEIISQFRVPRLILACVASTLLALFFLYMWIRERRRR